MTALFCDIVGFVQFVANCKPSDVLAVLNTLYTEFDRLTRVHDTFRVSGPYHHYTIARIESNCSNYKRYN